MKYSRKYWALFGEIFERDECWLLHVQICCNDRTEMAFAPQRFRGFTKKQLFICLAVALILVFAFTFNFKSSPKSNPRDVNQMNHKEEKEVVNHEEEDEVVDVRKQMHNFRKVCTGWRDGMQFEF